MSDELYVEVALDERTAVLSRLEEIKQFDSVDAWQLGLLAEAAGLLNIPLLEDADHVFMAKRIHEYFQAKDWEEGFNNAEQEALENVVAI